VVFPHWRGPATITHAIAVACGPGLAARDVGCTLLRMIRIVTADITRLDVDAIVNAANEWMLGGGGVDGAIHGAAGPELVEACRAVPEVRPGVRCPTGEARITPGFRLRARWVIHTVGPVWRGGLSGEPELLASAYRSSLALAAQRSLGSIAFPAISTGVFSYPLLPAARVAVRETSRFPGEVQLVAFDASTREVLEAALGELGAGRAG
jgi:O-acetyl-ADP-ribose deacetylase (regulator of RNase III)